jgi:NAD(P)H-flavin reductase
LSFLGTHPLSSSATQSDDSIYSWKKKFHGSEVKSISPSSSDSDVEKQPAAISPPVLNTSLTIYRGRPSVATIITETVAGADSQERIMVAVCGPSGMMRDVRNSIVENIKVNGPSLELHSEHFGK